MSERLWLKDIFEIECLEYFYVDAQKSQTSKDSSRRKG